jgi:hypothetical protein
MKTHTLVAPRVATIEHDEVRREGRPVPHRSRAAAAAAAAGIALAFTIGACTPAASGAPGGSLALPSVSVSAAASAASQAAIVALDQVDAAITTNQTSAGLTADEATSLKDLVTGVRTALQTGDVTAARTAVDNLSTKVDGFAAKLTGPAGEQLKAAITALKAALPAG